MDTVKSIIRRATRGDKLNIIVIGATHERYESTLAKTGHNFFCLLHGKEWNKKYATIPSNFNLIREIPYHEEFDLILLHTSGDRYNIAKQIQSYCDIPILKHCHVLPDIRYDSSQILYFQEEKVNKNSFISNFSKNAWGYKDAAVIPHGIDTSFWTVGSETRENRLLSVVNYWADRDWCCGWELWNTVSHGLPVKVVGDNPGLSVPAKNEKELVGFYQKHSVFLNTSLYSPVPMALLEAMACGCAVVSTATCMIPEIIEHNKNGFISNNPDELKEYCKLLLNDEEYARKIGNAARKTIEEKYNLSKFVDNWNNLFQEVIYK